MQISLRAGERIYINGAVLKVDRKVTIELVNEVSFLLESHILQAEDTVTPLRQLYFVLQAVLLDPTNADRARELFGKMFASTLASFSNAAAVAGLRDVSDFVTAGRIFDGLRALRALFPIEDKILSPNGRAPRAA
jgi:flagellar biosynthesis repressor protein FlbT